MRLIGSLMLSIVLISILGCKEEHKQRNLSHYNKESISNVDIYYKLNSDSLFKDSIILVFENKDTLFQKWENGYLKEYSASINGQKPQKVFHEKKEWFPIVYMTNEGDTLKNYLNSGLDIFYFSKLKLRMERKNKEIIKCEILNCPPEIRSLSANTRIIDVEGQQMSFIASKPGCFFMNVTSKRYNIDEKKFNCQTQRFSLTSGAKFALEGQCK